MNSFRYSAKVVLNEGDRIRVSGGPHFISQSGNKINMGEKGSGVFVRASEDGQAIYVNFDNAQNTRYVYIGPQYTSKSTGTIMSPHKITKMRKK